MANRNLPEPIKFITDVFVGALNILKPIFSIIIALYFAWYSFTFLSNNFQQELSMQCWAIGQLDASKTYEQIMDQQLSYNGPSSSLALDIKKAELATADLRTLIKYSSLVTVSKLANRLTLFVDKARSVGRDLQILQARTRRSLNNLITYNIFALKALEDVRDKKIIGQDALGSLADLDEMLIAIHDLATHDKKTIIRRNLELLKNLDKHRHTAVSQIQTTLYSLTSFQLDMEELREQVSRLSIIEMPVEVHIESIGKGIERLRNSKVALKSGGDTKISKLIDSSNENNDNNVAKEMTI
ncbi:hypothetical protein RIR_jg1905.t1 [Rhizophagus irregularis DAOM 181602=DAOM 197198]|nr:hypothetical protein RIR_jg1905.t1 [Rhizophagus irregularis DAOM 181602=DAOM 197198]